MGDDAQPVTKPAGVSRQTSNSTPDPSESSAPVSTYIVAQNPEVLAQLMKESQARGVCPSVYTTPATPFNSLAVQFQDEDKTLTTAIVSDLPFSDPILPNSESQSSSLPPDPSASEANLDSIESSDTVSSFLSNLSLTESVQSQSQSPNVARKQAKELQQSQSLYPTSSKLTGGVTADLYSPVQKFPPNSCASQAVEIYGPVANFSQSSVIVGNLSQSPSLAGNFAEACIPESSAHGPSSLPLDVAQSSLSFSQSNSCSIAQSMQQSQSCSIPTSASSAAAYSAMSSSTSSCSSAMGTENLYGPVMKFRAQTAVSGGEPKSASPLSASYMQNAARGSVYSPTPQTAQNYQAQSVYPQNYQQQQQIYSNVSQYSQFAQNYQRQNAMQTQNSAAPIYTVHATPTTVVQAQKLQQQQQQCTSYAHHPIVQTHYAAQTRQSIMPQVGKVFAANAAQLQAACAQSAELSLAQDGMLVEDGAGALASTGEVRNEEVVQHHEQVCTGTLWNDKIELQSARAP